jgi:predicted ArsR family transcriptional regulator
MIDIIKNLRAFGKIHLESSDINPLVEMMRGIATEAADRIEREAADRIEREAADRIERLEAVVEAAKYVDAWERGNEHECYIDLRKALEELAR